MSRSEQRLFVGNLPSNIQEGDLEELFSSYGTVSRVEVKHKKNPESDEILSTFAFVTLDIEQGSLARCLRESKQEKYQSRYLQVSVARENFLEKLKREREEAKALTTSKKNDQPHEPQNSAATTTTIKLPTIISKKADITSSSTSSSSEESSSGSEDTNKKPPVPCKPTTKASIKNKSTASSSDSGSESESDADGGVLLRKKSKAFLQNGKIKIDSGQNIQALHIIERKKNTEDVPKNFNEKSKKADQKRIESLKKMKDSYNQQKLTIKNALTAMDSSKKSNKIVFSDNEDETPLENSKSSPIANNKNIKVVSAKLTTSKKLSLFNEDDDSDDDDFSNHHQKFEVRKEFEGEKGAKLWKLQSRFQNDKRFSMNENFLDDGNGMDDDHAINDDHANDGNSREHNEANNSNDDEREWQFNILEKVIGKKLHNGDHSSASRQQKNLNKKAPTMLRFDPNCEDHTRFVSAPKKRTAKKRTPEIKTDDANEPKKRIRLESEQSMGENVPVSMDNFYKVSDNLKIAIGGSQQQFSLLSMFGRGGNGDADTASATAKQNVYEEKPIVQNSVKFLSDLNPFKYDSSDAEEDENDATVAASKRQVKTDMNDKRKTQWHETFFILSPDDERLSDGCKFFTTEKQIDANGNENNDSRKEELRNIVKRKIKKTMRNAKLNKRFKKFNRK